MKDLPRHKGKRKQLAELLASKGIKSKEVLEAINKVPRHLFLDSSFEEHAYQDKAFPIGADQTISQPYTVAFQSELLKTKKGHKVLEIGTGSGYQASVLVELGCKVFSIERQKELFDKTSILLKNLNYKPYLSYGDGYKGLPTYAPFDRIIVTAGAPFIPEALKQQLKVGGIMVIPQGEGDTQTMLEIIKHADDDFEIIEHGDFRFVPLLGDKN